MGRHEASTQRMPGPVRATCLVAAGLGLAAMPLTWGRAEIQQALASKPTTVDQVVGAAAVVALSGVLLWTATALVMCTLATAPGAVGRVSARVAAAVSPPVLRRVVSVAVGVSVVGGASPALGDVPELSRPGALAGVTTGDGVASPPNLPTLDRPAASAVITVAPGDSLWRIAANHLGSEAGAPDIAAEWPRWFEANRAVIGMDPDLIHPGQRLTAPD